MGKNVLWSVGKDHHCNVDKVNNKVIWAKGGSSEEAGRED